MPELLEISGIDDVGQDANPAPVRKTDYSGLFIGLGSIAAMLAIGYAVSKFMSGGSSDGLGVIKPCRKADLTSKKPKSKQKWCLWTGSGKRIIGRHPTKSRAIKQERLIEMKKHGVPTRS